MWVAELVETAWSEEKYGAIRSLSEIARNEEPWQLQIAVDSYVRSRTDWGDDEGILISQREG